jgi:predicted ATPase/class 3 adenylate cyclase
VKCEKCQTDNDEIAKFCANCGTILSLTCSYCGHKLPSTAKFCIECGTEVTGKQPFHASLEVEYENMREAMPSSFMEKLNVAGDGENRIVTVLLADMSSSVQATKDLDPEDAATLVSRLLKSMIDVLSKYECRIDNIVGDEVVAVFGAPEIHENDPERAILAGLEIIEAVKVLNLNASVGINTGEAFFGAIGSDEHRKKTVYGTVINLAARLQGAAAAGTIIAGESTYRHARQAFEFEPLTLEVKGFDSPVAVFRVVRPKARLDKVRGIEGLKADLIGRDEEFAKLEDTLVDVLKGQGQVVALIGEAGIGKSRLVSELKKLALERSEAPELLWLEGRCLELGVTASYWPFVDMFHQYFGWGVQDRGDTRAKAIVGFLEDFVAQGHLSSQQVENVAPYLGRLLSVRFDSEWDDRLRHADPDQIQHQTFLAVHDVLVAMSKQQPLVLVLEDLHWSDSLSLDLVSLLMEGLRFGRMLLLCVYRPEREHKCWHIPTIAQRKCPDRCLEIRLAELTPSHSRKLIESLLSINKLPNSTKELILRRSQGNPYFVEEVVRSLIDSGMVYLEGDSWHARDGVDAIGVPNTLQSVILGRVDRLQEDLKSILQSASVIGRVFRSRILSHIKRQETELEQKLLELEDAALIYQERLVPEKEYSFKHVLAQEAIYKTILKQKRALFHREVAEAMENLYESDLEEYCDELAYHYDRSDNGEKALEYLLTAAERAQSAYSNETAIEHYTSALARLESQETKEVPDPRRIDALVGIGNTLVVTGEAEAGETRLREAAALGEAMELPPAELIPIYGHLNRALYVQNKWEGATEVAEKSLALVGDNEASTHAAIAYVQVAYAYRQKGDTAKWREFFHRIEHFVLDLPASRQVISHCYGISLVYEHEKNSVEAGKWLEISERIARSENDFAEIGQVLMHKGRLLEVQGDLVGACEKYVRASTFSHKVGDERQDVIARFGIVSCLKHLGQLERAHEYLPSEDVLSHMEDRAVAAAGSAYAASLIVCQGPAEAAEYVLRNLIESYEQSILVNISSNTFANLGLFWWLQNMRCHVLLKLCKFNEAKAAFARTTRTAASMRGTEQTEWGIPRQVVATVAGVEEACEDPSSFRAIVADAFGSRQARTGRPPIKWFLTTAEPEDLGAKILDERFTGQTLPAWTWQNPFDDSKYAVRDGLIVHAANGRDLWRSNQSAPRLVRPVDGDFAAQATAMPGLSDRPSMGGILIWKNDLNYIYLARGLSGEHDLCFMGSTEGQEVILGRGRLASDRILLRFEKVDNTVCALCSVDGTEWYLVGKTEFSVDDPVMVGLVAMGDIDRGIYFGAFREGTAIRFESFELWRK